MISKFSKFESLYEKAGNNKYLIIEGVMDDLENEIKNSQKEISQNYNDISTAITNYLRLKLNLYLSDEGATESIMNSDDTKRLINAASDLKMGNKYSNPWLKTGLYILYGAIATGGAILAYYMFIRNTKFAKNFRKYSGMFSKKKNKTNASDLDYVKVPIDNNNIIKQNPYIVDRGLEKSGYTKVTLKDIPELKQYKDKDIYVDNFTGNLFYQKQGGIIMPDGKSILDNNLQKYITLPKSKIKNIETKYSGQDEISDVEKSGIFKLASDITSGKYPKISWLMGGTVATGAGFLGYHLVDNLDYIIKLIKSTNTFEGINDLEAFVDKDPNRRKEIIKDIAENLDDAFFRSFSNSADLGLSIEEQKKIKSAPGWSKYANDTGRIDKFSWNNACGNDVEKIGWAVLWFVAQSVYQISLHGIANLISMAIENSEN